MAEEKKKKNSNMIAIKKDKNKKALLSKHITLEKVPNTDKAIKKRKTKKGVIK